MTLPTIYARYEPTTDAVARQYAPQQRWTDLVVYHNAAATQLYARRMLVTPARSGQTPTLTINGFRWPVQWLPALNEQP